MFRAGSEQDPGTGAESNHSHPSAKSSAAGMSGSMSLVSLETNCRTERTRRWWFWCLGIPFPTNQTSRPTSISIQSRPPYGLRCCYCQRSCHSWYHGTNRHPPCRSQTLPHGHVTTFQRRPSPRAISCSIFGWQRSMQIYSPDFCAEGTKGQDRRASQGQLFQAGRAWGYVDVRGHSLCLRR